MSASISISPPPKALHADHLWMELQSNLVATNNSYFRITSSGANTVGQTVAFTFGGTTVTFTIAATPDSSGLQLPQRVAQTAEEYAEELAVALAKNEIITNTFVVYHEYSTGIASWVTYMRAIASSALSLSVVEDVSNAVFSTFPSTGLYMEDNLRALIELYTSTGDMSTEQRLGQQHAPYNTDRKALFDLSSHFAALDPQPPSTVGLDTFHVSSTPSMMQKYFVRYADKYGTPAVAEAMEKTPEYLVFFGSHAATSEIDYATATLLHVTTQLDGITFWKPIGQHQPDWTYYYCLVTKSDYNHALKIYWTDGTATSYTGSAFSMAADNLYNITTGALQLDIEGKATTAGKTPYRYGISLIDGADTYYWTRLYRIKPECHDWGHILLYTNGCGGMDTLWLDGKATAIQNSSAAFARRIRTNTWSLADGDTLSYDHSASPSWKTSTGWYDDKNYINHLRQLPLARKAWIVDTENERFLPVHIQPGELQIHEDDQDLFALEFNITAAWINKNFNE